MRILRLVMATVAVMMAIGCGDDDVTKPPAEIPATVKVECEDKTAELNLGLSNLHLNEHLAASGGEAVEGLDIIGEWIEIPAEFQRSGSYNMTFRHAAVHEVGVKISVLSPGMKRDDVEWNVALNAGTCGTWPNARTYSDAAGSSAQQIEAGSYKIRIAVRILDPGEIHLVSADCVRFYIQE